jgi:hypothetical protein
MPLPASAQDAYVIGLTGALTGPPASTYAPAVDALRIYVDRVNAAGGVNGKKINLILQDDSAQPGKAAANAKKLITQDNVILVLNASLSSTYAPVTSEASRPTCRCCLQARCARRRSIHRPTRYSSARPRSRRTTTAALRLPSSRRPRNSR